MAEVVIDDYRKYSITESKFTLEKSVKKFNYPWAISFIDRNNVVITEKDGGLYRLNL